MEEFINWLLDVYNTIMAEYRKCLGGKDQARCLRNVYNKLLLLCTNYKPYITKAEEYTPMAISIANSLALLGRDIATRIGEKDPC